MLLGLPNLQKLYCPHNHSLTGSLSSVRVLFGSLVELVLSSCNEVTGSLEDVSDFPRLEIFQVNGTKVTGDIREIGRDDFKSLKKLDL
eukprot:scaffold82058_cov62-Attheya_sp.AAC.3